MEAQDLPLALSDRFRDALLYATELHAGQFRKGTDIPYISHLYSVACLVMEASGTEDEVIAALLHDAVEDQGGHETLVAIKDRFGQSVASIVMGCTDDAPPPGTPKKPWRQRKEAYIAHIGTASRSVRLVSSADKLHNARAILTDLRQHGPVLWDRFSASMDEVLWYYRTLADAFFDEPPSERLADELQRTVSEIEQLANAKE